MARKISITLEFTEESLDRLLREVTFDGTAPKVAGLSEAQFEQLKRELEWAAPNFVDDIIETAKDAAANDWLCELTEQWAVVA